MNNKQIVIFIIGILVIAMLYVYGGYVYENVYERELALRKGWMLSSLGADGPIDFAENARKAVYNFMAIVGILSIVGIVAAKSKIDYNNEDNMKNELESKLDKLLQLKSEGILTDEEYNYKREDTIMKYDL